MVRLKLISKESKRQRLRAFSMFRKKAKESGLVEFFENKFIIIYNKSKHSIDLSTVSEINILSDYYKGRTPSAYENNNSTRTFSSGIMKIEFIGKEKIGKHFNVIIENESEFHAFTSTLKHWYLDFDTLVIKEYNPFKSDRKLLLEDIFNYERTQTLKKSLGIKSIYS